MTIEDERRPDVWQGWGPFRHDDHGYIWAEGAPHGTTPLFQVRGWGLLTGQGFAALGLPREVATAISNNMGDTLAALLNERFPTPTETSDGR